MRTRIPRVPAEARAEHMSVGPAMRLSKVTILDTTALKETKRKERRANTPCPKRDRSASKDNRNASQGNETFRRFPGYFGDPGPGPWRLIVRDPAQLSPATADEGAAPAVPAAAPTQPDADTAPGVGLEEEDRGGRKCGECPGRGVWTNTTYQSQTVQTCPGIIQRG